MRLASLLAVFVLVLAAPVLASESPTMRAQATTAKAPESPLWCDPERRGVVCYISIFEIQPEAKDKSIEIAWIQRSARNQAARTAFRRLYHCPSTDKPRGDCPGYIIDHVIPLCAGGADDPLNMQWQTIADAKFKDRDERAQCRKNK